MNKRPLSALLLMIISVLLLVACDPSVPSEKIVDTRISVPFSSSVVSDNDKDYIDIVLQLQNAGFTEIYVEGEGDLITGWIHHQGELSSITINGESFSSGKKFEPNNATVRIKYHSYEAEAMHLYGEDLPEDSATETSEETEAEQITDSTEKYTLNISVNFIPNLIFSRYDVKIKIDGIEETTLVHGEDGNFSFSLNSGKHTFDFEKSNSPSIKGSISFDVKGDINAALKISCYSDKVEVEKIYIEDWGSVKDGQTLITVNASELMKKTYSEMQRTLESFGFTNISLVPLYDVQSDSEDRGTVTELLIAGKNSFNRGDIFNADVPIIITYHEDEDKDPIKIAAAEALAKLEKVIPKEIARRAVVVSMTNAYATDVFTSDGNYYDEKKFHSYSDIGGYFLTVEKDGEWSALDESTWHIEGIVLRIYDFDTYLKVSGNLKTDGNNYVFFNVESKSSAKAYINSTDPSKTGINHYEPSDNNPFCTVPYSLISENRDEVTAKEKMTAKEKRQQWINGQFSIINGSHTTLTKMIKEQLNDSKSFEHIKTTYIDICDSETQNTINNLLINTGYSSRVEVGDLFISETFTAKNLFNATVKCTAYGISKPSGSVILVCIE